MWRCSRRLEVAEIETRYERNLPALSEEECELLRGKRVAVIGCGGIGGYLIELLSRIGVGHIRAVDGDVFEESNLNRQLFSERELIGCSKAEAAEARVKRINPGVEIEAVSAWLNETNAARFISGCDAVLDGLDNIPARRVLAAACTEAGVPYVYGAISGWIAQAAVSLPGDGLIDALYPENARLQDKSALSFAPALCASMQAALCVKLLTGRPVESGTLYYFDLLNMELETVKLKTGEA